MSAKAHVESRSAEQGTPEKGDAARLPASVT
jgi:hypothetical protein